MKRKSLTDEEEDKLIVFNFYWKIYLLSLLLLVKQNNLQIIYVFNGKN